MNFLHQLVRRIFSKSVFLSIILAVVVFNTGPLFFEDPEMSGIAIVNAESQFGDTTLAGQLQSTVSADSDIKKKVAEICALFLALFTPLIAMVVKFVGSLMGDEFIFGSNSSGGSNIVDLLYSLWHIVRTVVNYAFFLLLLFFAVMNIIPGPTQETYSLKELLPKFVLAIVIINLTWFGARFVFDIVDLGTRIVFGLPQELTNSSFDEAIKEGCTIDKVSNKVSTKGVCYPAYIKINPKEAINSSPNELNPDTLAVDSDGNPIVGEDGNNLTILSAEIKTAEDRAKKIKDDKKLGEGSRSYEAAMTTVNTLKTLEDKQADGGGIVAYGPITIYWTKFNYELFNEGTIAPLMAFSLMQIQNLPMIASSHLDAALVASEKADINQAIKIEGGKEVGWTNLLINAVMALIIMLITLVLFILMLINLFFRVIVIWVNIILSPFLGITMFFGDKIGLGSMSNEYVGAGAFLKHAFAPVIMGIPLVIGFIMVVAGKQSQVLNIEGEIVLDGALLDGVSSIHQLFYYLLILAVLWVGGTKAVEATSASQIHGMFIEPIKNGVTSLAQAAAKAPMHIQFIPVGGDGEGGTKTATLNNIFSDAPNTLRNIMPTKGRQNWNDLIGKEPTYTDDLEKRFGSTYKNQIQDPIKSMDLENQIKSIVDKNPNASENTIRDKLLDIPKNEPLKSGLNGKTISLREIIAEHIEPSSTNSKVVLDAKVDLKLRELNVIGEKNKTPDSGPVQAAAKPAPVPGNEAAEVAPQSKAEGGGTVDTTRAQAVGAQPPQQEPSGTVTTNTNNPPA